MSKSSEQQVKEIVVHYDASLKNIWVDSLYLAFRDDDVCFCRLAAALPEGLFEQIRFMTSRKKLEEFIDTLCSATGYYPEKKGVKREPRVKPAAK